MSSEGENNLCFGSQGLLFQAGITILDLCACVHTTIIFADSPFFVLRIVKRSLDVHFLDRKHLGAPSHFSGSQAIVCISQFKMGRVFP